MKAVILALLVAFAALPAMAVEPNEVLSDPALEQRARDISKNLRCVVCQNQSIDDSDAELAKDLRVLVRERLVKGDSNQQVVDYLVSRYGDYVLLQPPFKAKTLVLWIGPAVLLVVGLLSVFFMFRRRASGEVVMGEAAAPLSDEEKKRLKALLKDNEG